MKISEVGIDNLHQYAEISIAFDVETILSAQPLDDGLGGIAFTEEQVSSPYRKDADEQDGGPITWPSRFDMSKWGIFLASEGDECVGGAAVFFDIPELQNLNMAKGDNTLAVLWDIRVNPESRGSGIGKMLLRHVAQWARSRGCRQLEIETQNNNVRACRFYASQGCQLGGINRYAYVTPGVEDEVMLLWYLDLRNALSDSQGSLASSVSPNAFLLQKLI